MKKLLIACCCLTLAAAAPKKLPETGRVKMSVTVTSPSFRNNEFIPAKHACGGGDMSPELNWTGLPAGTRSVAVIADDPDAPPGTWVHWLIFDIPAELGGLPENLPKGETLPDGSRQGLAGGVKDEDCSRTGYSGPCPPPGKPHRYFFKVYALDKMLGLPPGTAKGALLKAMKGHILAQGELVGLYKR